MSSCMTYDHLGEEGFSEEAKTKERLLRQLDREVRDLSTIDARKAAKWFIGVTWPVLLFQSAFAFFNVYANRTYDWTVHTNVMMLPPGYRPHLLYTLQAISAFLTGLSLIDSVKRFKRAMQALLGLRNSVESLRVQLLASTSDPKLQTAVQVFLTMMIVLIQKDIVFFTENFDTENSILAPVQPDFRRCVCFCPEVLWTFSRREWDFMFFDFLTHACLLDPEHIVKSFYKDLLGCWTQLEQMVTVRAPKTRHMMTRFSVQLFFIVIPLFNEDVVTQCMVPLVAALFIAMVELAQELTDPFITGNVHNVPLRTAMKYLAMPAYTENDDSTIEAIEWLNRGLKGEGGNRRWETSSATWAEHPVPREKKTYPNKGSNISFEDARTIPQIVNMKCWENFIKHVTTDMDAAESRGRRMPVYLRESRKRVSTMIARPSQSLETSRVCCSCEGRTLSRLP